MWSKNIISVIMIYLHVANGIFWNATDIRYHHCCPDENIKFYIYTPKYPMRQRIDISSEESLIELGWKSVGKNVIIVHGYNGTESKRPMSFVRDAYLQRGYYNVFTVDWAPLARYPRYLSAVSNAKLVGQCAARLYSRLIREGASSLTTTCVGHSLGAHICGMMSNHLPQRQHKIIGLDPAKPLVAHFRSDSFRLTRDDACVVQVIHTNAGLYGMMGLVGHADFCVNGGTMQNGCRGNIVRRARCSHFMSACIFAEAIKGRNIVGVPCKSNCPTVGCFDWKDGRTSIILGEETPEGARGMYCVKIDYNEECPFE